MPPTTLYYHNAFVTGEGFENIEKGTKFANEPLFGNSIKRLTTQNLVKKSSNHVAIYNLGNEYFHRHVEEMHNRYPAEFARMTPLEVMLAAMTACVAKGDLKMAGLFAKEAAPYVHPKLTAVAIQNNTPKNIDKMTDEELVKFVGDVAEGSEASDGESEGNCIEGTAIET